MLLDRKEDYSKGKLYFLGMKNLKKLGKFPKSNRQVGICFEKKIGHLGRNIEQINSVGKKSLNLKSVV
jgi:hypothetical protein